MSPIREILSYSFLVKAFIDGMMVPLCASLLGVSLVFRRCSMTRDGLFYVSFGALSIALATGWFPLKTSIPVVVLAAFFLLQITENSRAESNAAITLALASVLALGIIVTSLAMDMTMGVSNYMFGSILTMSREDIWLNVVLSLVVLGLFVICCDRMFAMTFDENFARVTEVSVGRYGIIITALTVIIIVLGMRMMGTMSISNLVISPCLSSMRIFKNFGGVMMPSGILSPACSLAGMVTSYQFSMPAGASVAVVNLRAFLLFMTWQLLGRLKGWYLRPTTLPAGCFTGRLFPVFQ